MTEQDPESRPDASSEDGANRLAGIDEETPTDEVGDRESETVDDGPELTPATGHPAVDEVLRSLDDLEGRPVDEHVATFEKAHEELRRALSSAGEDQD